MPSAVRSSPNKGKGQKTKIPITKKLMGSKLATLEPEDGLLNRVITLKEHKAKAW